MIDHRAFDYSSIKDLPDLIEALKREGVYEGQYQNYILSYQERKAREKGIPLNGIFELTPLCNLNCKMCYVHPQDNQLNGKKLLTFDQWKSIIMQAHSLGMLHATLTGGECLTYPWFDEVYLYLRSIGIKPTVKTNGVLLNKDRIHFFMEHPPRSIMVTVYGSSNEAYNEVTGYPAFDTVFENLCLLKETDIPVRLCVTPSRYMLTNAGEIFRLIKEFGYPHITNYALFPPRTGKEKIDCDLSTEEYVELMKLHKSVFSYGDNSGNISDDAPADETVLPEHSYESRRNRGINCGAGMSTFTVNWDGQISGCDNLRGPYASVLDQPFSIAWSSIHKAAIEYIMPIECSTCKYNRECMRCAALHQLHGRKGHCDPSICDRTKRFITEGIIPLAK